MYEEVRSRGSRGAAMRFRISTRSCALSSFHILDRWTSGKRVEAYFVATTVMYAASVLGFKSNTQQQNLTVDVLRTPRAT